MRPGTIVHRRRIVAAALWAVSLAGAFASAGEGDWWHPDWPYRRPVTFTTAAAPAEQVCSAVFPTGGHAARDGRDIRVVARGKEVPHRLVFMGPGTLCHVVFPVQPGLRRCDIYYGNPRAPVPRYDWTPKAGLLLETRRFAGGNVSGLPALRRAFEQSESAFGADFVAQAFHGYNLFGPSEAYISRYSGWIECPAEGEYEFSVDAGGVAVLALDDKPVVVRDAWGGPAGEARFQGKATLSKGIHAFELLVAFRGGRPAAVAAWKPPGAEKPDVIPPRAFPGVVRAKRLALERADGELAPDFSWTNEGEAFVGARTLVLMQFRDETALAGATGYAREWDFGDGVTSSEPTPRHVFLDAGDHRVSLRVSWRGQEYVSSQMVRVDRAWDLQTSRAPDAPEKHAAIVKKYAFEALTPDALAGALALLAEVKDWDAFGSAARALTAQGRLEKMPPALLAETALLVVEHTRGTLRDPDAALALCRRAEALARDASDKARLALEAGDTYLYFLNQPDRAGAEYARLLQAYPTADRMRLRMAYIRLGDVRAQQGEYDAARAAYENAERIRVSGPARDTFGIGARAFETEAYLRLNDLESAYDALQAWQWEHPTDKLVGEWSVLMGKWAIAAKKPDEALKNLLVLHKVNPRSPYVPEALFLAAQCHEALGRADAAISALETLRKDYPESPFKEQALRTIGRLSARLERSR